MSPLHCIEFLIISGCFHIFTLITYIIYYGDVINSNYFKDFKKEYDYVIVGCGTSGSIIAHQLATKTNYSFIVLEAGGRNHDLFQIPVLGPLLHGSIYDWQYKTVQQKDSCLAMKNQKCKSPQGKIIGGSSAINNMVYVRGNISHYVDWFSGKHSREFIQKQFENIERNILHLDSIKYNSELSNAILDAAKELGYNNIGLDFNLGFSKTIVSQKNGKRWSSSNKLDFSEHVLTNALVEKIIFNGNTAVGVKFLISGVRYDIFAKKGVIISSGAYNTPKVLQLSGIGPKDLLNKLNIEVIKNLPVGKNLQDHVTTGLDLVQFNKSVSVNSMDMINPFNAFEYFINGRGPLTSPGCEAVGFLSTKNQATPDLQFMVLSAGLASDRGTLLRKTVNIHDVAWNNYFSLSFDKYVATILPVILHPKSRGEVYIKSKDPKISPAIDPRYLTHKDDLNVLINGVRLIKQFVETSAMQNIGASLNEYKFPGCEKYDFFTDSYLECYVKHLTLTSFHPIGTCSMGLSTSKNAVVDTSFQVIGVNNLYVVDASVLPTMPSGNINAAVAMMAQLFFDTTIGLKSSKITNSFTSFCSKRTKFYDEFICTI